MMEKSRWDLTDDEVETYLGRSFDYIIDLLDASRSRRAVQARSVGRRTPLRRSETGAARGAAPRWRRARPASRREQHFGMPPSAAAATRSRLPEPLYVRPAPRQQLIDALRVGAALRLLHHGADQHALKLLLAAAKRCASVGMLGEHLVDPAPRAPRRRRP